MSIASNPSSSPIVTVFIPVYNREKFISGAIDSVLAQSFPDYELIIVDDGSTDSTSEILKERASKDSRIRVIRQENQGAGAAANRAFEEARGKYLCRLDSDDAMLPDRISEQMYYMDHNPDLVMCASWLLVEDLRKGGELREGPHWPEHHERVDAAMLFRCVLTQPATMFRLDAVREHNIKYEPKWENFEDYPLFAEICKNHRVAIMQRPLITYRKHGDATTQVYKARLRELQHDLKTDMLRNVGLEPSVSDVRNFVRFSYQECASKDELRRCVELLKRIIAANALTERYEPESLNHSIRNACLQVVDAVAPPRKRLEFAREVERHNLIRKLDVTRLALSFARQSAVRRFFSA